MTPAENEFGDADGTLTCPGCGLVGGPAEGPTHPYMLSSPRCWSLYGELLAVGGGQLSIDSYAVQHPGVPESRSIQSVGVHLVSLCAAFERSWPHERATHLIHRAVDLNPGWQWLDPEPPLGTITVAEVVGENDLIARSEIVTSWAEEMWGVYEDHHSLVRQWLDAVLGE